MAGMLRAQMARGINDDTYADVAENDEEDDRDEPGALEFSDDEEEPFREEDEAFLGEFPPLSSTSVPGSLEEWLRDVGCRKEMLDKIDEMQKHAAVHGLGPKHEGFRVKSRAITAKDLEAETKMVICKKSHAYEADGKLKKHIISVKDLTDANPEMQGILETAEERTGSSVHLCYGEDEDVDVATIDVEEYIIVEIVLDSGAGEHVADRIDAPGYTVTESDGSKRGQNFLAAGGHKMPNQGEMNLRLKVPNGGRAEEEISSIFQVAAVTRPLWSVSKICDKGHWVKFTQKDATVYTAADVPVCTFERRGGLYVGKVKLRNPRHPGFTRPAIP